MQKTGNILFLLFGLIAAPTILFAQPGLKVSLSEDTIFTGEQIRLDLTITGAKSTDVPRPALPEINGLRLIPGSTSVSTSFTVVQGQPSVTITYGYILIAQQPGKYQVQPITLTIDRVQVTSQPVAFTIVDRNSLPDTDPNKHPDIFSEIELTTKNPVPGEQIIASVVLYFKEGIEVSSYQPMPGWKAEGFWKEELNNIQRPTATSILKGNIRYRKALLIQYALFPTKSGELELSPFELSVTVRTQRSMNSMDFWSFGSNQQRLSVETKPVKVSVKPLPALANAIYSGAVGEFEISRSLSTRQAIVGESVEVTTVIKGIGNVPLISKPEYSFPDGLEMYQPQESSSINRRDDQINGSKTFSDVLLARKEGNYEIPEVNVAHFNPKTKRYVVKTLPALSFEVLRDPNATLSSLEEMQLQVAPVIGLVAWKPADSGSLFGSTFSWVLVFIPPMALGLGFLVYRHRLRLQTDSGFARTHRAYDEAMKLFASITSSRTDPKQCYATIRIALIGFIADRKNMPHGGLSDDEYMQVLSSTKMSETDKNELRRLLEKCTTISYAPKVDASGVEADVQKGMKLLGELKKWL